MTERPVGTPDPNAGMRWVDARAWYSAANEADIEAALARAPGDRTSDDWMRLAAIALDQAGCWIRNVSVSR